MPAAQAARPLEGAAGRAAGVCRRQLLPYGLNAVAWIFSTFLTSIFTTVTSNRPSAGFTPASIREAANRSLTGH